MQSEAREKLVCKQPAARTVSNTNSILYNMQSKVKCCVHNNFLQCIYPENPYSSSRSTTTTTKIMHFVYTYMDENYIIIITVSITIIIILLSKSNNVYNMCYWLYSNIFSLRLHYRSPLQCSTYHFPIYTKILCMQFTLQERPSLYSGATVFYSELLFDYIGRQKKNARFFFLLWCQAICIQQAYVCIWCLLKHRS